MKRGTVLVAALLAGCATTTRVEKVSIPVPVVCDETMPSRPVMPTENLPESVGLDAFAAAAIAEIERREGYEGQLRTALAACIAPLEGK